MGGGGNREQHPQRLERRGGRIEIVILAECDLLRHQAAADVKAALVALVDVHPPGAQRLLPGAGEALGHRYLVPDLPAMHELELLRARGRDKIGGQKFPRILVPNVAGAELQEQLGLIADSGLLWVWPHLTGKLIF